MTDEFELFNPADFQSIELLIEFNNLSTGKSVREVRDVALLEVRDKGFTLEIPVDNCAADNHVLIKIFQLGSNAENPKPLFNTTGKITDVRPVGDADRLAVVVELIQFDKKGWSDFISVFSRRQEEISKFFEMGKK